MKLSKRSVITALFTLLSGAAQASGSHYEVTVTNLTSGQIMSPVLVAVHERGNDIFELGMPASPELAAAAQDADYSGLIAALQANPGVGAINVGTGLLFPGASETIMLPAMDENDQISLVSMLVTTNDGFIGLSGHGTKKKGAVTVMAPALDAGSEYNSESCAHIPGPPCGSPFMSPDQAGEGFVHVHSGIHGIADLDPAYLDWNNPAARIVIRRVND